MALGTIVPTTELEAINDMLASVGTLPVTSLEAPVAADVETAVNLIRRVMKDVQAHGWHFNTDRGVVLPLDEPEEEEDEDPQTITIPDGVLRLKKSRTVAQRGMDIAHRHEKLWDRVNNTDLFEGPVTVDIVRALDFESMPESARSLVVRKAGREFQEKTLGSSELSAFSKEAIDLAMAELVDAEGLLEDTDFIENFPDQQLAWKVVNDVSVEVQSRGWKFNTRINVPVEAAFALDDEDEPIEDGPMFLSVPEGTLVAKSANTSQMAGWDLAHRGSHMFDVQRDSFDFSPEALSGWTSLPNGKAYLDIIMFVEFEDLPIVAQTYIKIRASRQLQNQKNPTQPEKAGYTQEDEARALKTLRSAEGSAENYNMLRNASVARGVLDRHAVYGSGSMRRWARP